MTLQANWSYPTTVKFGPGRIKELGEACLSLGIKNPLLVTDKILAQLDITQNALAILKSSGFEGLIFCEVDPNPNEVNLEAGLSAYRKGNHDGVVAFGGGSGIDLGKMVAFMAGQKRPIWDFEDIGDWWTRADSAAIAPIVAVGPLLEQDQSWQRRNNKFKFTRKKDYFSPKSFAQCCDCDPELTVGMPPFVTAGTGLDAFAHCVEAFSSPHYHPMSQGIAVEGMRLVIENLPKVYNNPKDIEARSHMMSAAMMGATAFQKGLGAIHALSHPIGAMYNTHHGTTNAVCMPAVLDLNASKISQRFDQVAGYIGIQNGFGFCTFVREFNASLKIPMNLSELGVVNVDVEKLTEATLKDPSCGGNPVTLNSENVTKLIKDLL